MSKTTPPATKSGAGLKESLSKLSDREKKLLAAMAGIFFLLATLVTVSLFQRSLQELETDTQNLQQALNTLALAGPAYAQRTASAEEADPRAAKFSDEVLKNNELRLTSFVATHAAATNITVNSYDEDQMPLGSRSKTGVDAGPVVIERTLRADIREAQMDNLLQLLDRIENSGEPVVIKRLDVRAQRGREGQVRAMLIVSTYERRDKES